MTTHTATKTETSRVCFWCRVDKSLDHFEDDASQCRSCTAQRDAAARRLAEYAKTPAERARRRRRAIREQHDKEDQLLRRNYGCTRKQWQMAVNRQCGVCYTDGCERHNDDFKNGLKYLNGHVYCPRCWTLERKSLDGLGPYASEAAFIAHLERQGKL